MNIPRAVSFSLVLLSLVGCTHRQRGRSFTGPGFAHPLYSYDIDPEGDALLSTDWQLLNYRQDGERYVEKRHEPYYQTISVDFDDDGVVDRKVELPTYDLLFRHRRNSARIGVRSLPLNARDRETEPRALARMVLQQSAGSDFMLYSNGHGVGSVERSYAPRLIREASVAVAGRPAWEMVYDLVSLERHQVHDSAVWRREAVVLVRSGMPFPVTGFTGPRTLPTVMVFTLSAFPEDFSEMLDELMGLIARLHFHDTEDPSTREAALACTEADMVGFVKIYGRQVIVPGLPEAEADCVREALPDLEPGAYSFGREYQPPVPPEPAPTIEQPSVIPASPYAPQPTETPADGEGAAPTDPPSIAADAAG